MGAQFFMKYIESGYKAIIFWIGVFTIAIVLSGVTLFFMNGIWQSHTFGHSLQIVTPHLFSMSVMVFVILHFFLFMKNSETFLRWSMLLFGFAFIDQMALLLNQTSIHLLFSFLFTLQFAAVSVYMLIRLKEKG